MIISKAICKSHEYGELVIEICSDIETEELFASEGNNTHYFMKYDRPLADTILRTATQKDLPAELTCNGVEYTLTRYRVINNEERIYNSYRKNHINEITELHPSSEIYVYTQRCRCVKCYSQYGFDSIINICGYVPLCANRAKSVPIDMQKCTRCLKFFIDIQSLQQYESMYGKLDIIRSIITGNEAENKDEFSGSFAPD